MTSNPNRHAELGQWAADITTPDDPDLLWDDDLYNLIAPLLNETPKGRLS